MDWQAHETEAGSAIAAASTLAELDDVRVRYLGRKSELAQALRGVRDRESGMLLNGIRGRLEASLDERRAGLERAELEHRPARADRLVDVERHVLDHAPRPRVVEPRDLVVRAHAAILLPMDATRAQLFSRPRCATGDAA
jgi:hypothetical protein